MSKHRYAWRGTDRLGRTQSGDIQASSQHEVRQRLHAQRIRVTRVQRQYDLPQWLKLPKQPLIPSHEISRLTRLLATLLHAGIPLLQALDILLRGETAPKIRALILTLYTDVESGSPLSFALAQHGEFDALYCTLVTVGELTGKLDTLLLRLADHLEKSETLRATLRSALTYPCAVLAIACTVLWLILVFVVPAFQNIFASFGAELPWLTRCVIDMSALVQQHGLYTLVFVLAFGGWLRREIHRRPDWQTHWHHVCLKLPIAGQLIRQACTARWTHALGILSSAGVPLTEALESVSGVTGHRVFQAATHAVREQLVQGVSLSKALESQAAFPLVMVQMCAIGEESGALDHMLHQTAEHFEHEVDRTVARLSTLLEPFIVVVLGVLIGGLVMALYLPIFQLGQVV